MRAVLEGFSSALHHVVTRPTVGLALLVVMAVRFCFGLCTLVVLLLFQKYFTEDVGILRTGPTGIAEVLAVGAIGVFLGALVTAARSGASAAPATWSSCSVSRRVATLALGGQFTIDHHAGRDVRRRLHLPVQQDLHGLRGAGRLR